MTTESVLKKSWALAVKHWQFLAVFALIGLAINVVVGIVMTGSLAGGLGGFLGASFFTSMSPASLMAGPGASLLGLGILLGFLATPLLVGANAHLGKVVVEGNSASAWQPYQAALGQYLTYLLLAIVMGIVLAIGFALLIVPGVILVVLLGLAPFIVAYEGVGVGDALRRAWDLGLKHFWTILLVTIIVGAIGMVVSLIAGSIPLVGAYLSSVVSAFGALAFAVLYTESK